MTRRQKILSVLLGAVLVLSVVAATYAYFTASVNRVGNTGIVEVTTTKLANTTLHSIKSSSNPPIYPGWVGYQGVEVNATGEGRTIYDLSLLITGDSNILDDILVTICKVEDSIAALAAGDFTFTAATAQVDNSVSPARYYMINGVVTLPSPCTSVVENVRLSTLGNSYQISTTGGKVLEASKYDKYYISYTYDNKGEAQTQGENFTVTPVIASRADSIESKEYFADTLKNKANAVANTNYNTSTAAQKAEMYTFSHAATAQTPALTDYRYIGSSPNNYVYFNCTDESDVSTCETWRILGVFPVDDGTGTYVDRVKIISSGNYYGEPFNAGWDVENEWVFSTLANTLNKEDYFNRTSHYSSNGLTQSAKKMMKKATWYLGTFDFGADYDGDEFETCYPNNDEENDAYLCDLGIATSTLYSSERSNLAPVNHSLKTSRYGVGLIYPSDYGYTYAYGVDNNCFSDLYGLSCSQSTNHSNSWILNMIGENEKFWTLTPLLNTKMYDMSTDFDSNYALMGSVWLMNGAGGIYDEYYWYDSDAAVGSWNNKYKPVVYLDSSVELDLSVDNQDGSLSHPYVLTTESTTLITVENEVDDSGVTTPNVPHLVNNLIPVVYDEDIEEWKMSETTPGVWYDYSEQKWANAVTVTSTQRGTYSVGDTIEMEDILGMWVWIPRFEYKYTNLNSLYAGGSLTSPGQISIKFVNGTSTTESPNYIIHPAFRNGSITYTNHAYTTTSAYQMGGWDEELTGFWIGKFETSSLTNASSTSASIDTDPIVKPNEIARRYQNASQQYNTALNIKTYHGINTMDSHMIKNSEWGAVAYLSQSKYGIMGTSDYAVEGFKGMFINDSDDYYTGCSSGESAEDTSNSYNGSTYTYDVWEGTGASTSGTIYGVYDMAGGTQDRTMTYYLQNGWNSSTSGFNSAPSNHKYYEQYTMSDFMQFCGGLPCYGHAINETRRWFHNDYILSLSSEKWISRSISIYANNYTTSKEYYGAGIFNYTGITGSSNSVTGTHAILI